MFNWTIFQSRDATIHKKFVHIYKKKGDDFHSKQPETFLFKNKSKDFCWIVSHCDHLFSRKRFEIANSLNSYLTSKVHIWGKAVELGCVNTSYKNIVDHGENKGAGVSYYDTAQNYIKDCKFYFAFENTNCSDYVTEKFMNAIEVGAIPIVNGWWDTYRELLPGSYIHVNEFANTSQLAEYLESLLKDEKKMKKYHEWRKFYRYGRTGVKAACELCHKLEKLKLAQIAGNQSDPAIIENMAEKFKTLQNCSP